MLETLASAIMMAGLVVLLIIDLTQPLDFGSYWDYMDSHLYLVLTAACTVIYSAIFYLHIKDIPIRKWKRLIIATSIALVVAILPMRFFLKPRRWDIEFRHLFAIDFMAIIIFFLLKFTERDTKSTVLVAIFFGSPLVFVYTNFAVRRQQKANSVIYLATAAGVYLIVFWLGFKHVSQRAWKVIIVLVFMSGIVAVCLVIIFTLTSTGMDGVLVFFVFLNTSSAFVLWLWMYAPKVRAWWKISVEHELYANDQNIISQIAGLPTWFSLEELNAATGNFQAPIGEGGSGAVFKGVKEDGSTIAVKWIKGQRNGEQEFMNEVTIIANLQHVNLVHLLGYCTSPRGDWYLVYPYFENGSLDSWLFAEEEKRSRLAWEVRYSIAIGVAKALAYLHHEYHHQILHLDVKPANILLDDCFRAILSDFGISKSIGRDESRVMTRARGTVGYLPPEMLVPNAISIKCDVYSYGMVLLELVGGRKNFQSGLDEETQRTRNTYFPQIAREKLIEGKLLEIVDQSLIKNQAITEGEVIILVQVALWCIQENPELRPTMAEVADMLEGRIPVEMPPESSMFVVNFLDVLSGSYEPDNHAFDEENALLSSNTISISIQSGR